MYRNRIVAPVVAILAILAAGCSKDGPVSDSCQIKHAYGSDRHVILIIKNRADSASVQAADEIKRALQYAKTPFNTTSTRHFASDFSIPETARLIYIATTELQELSDSDIEHLLSFVAEGNSLILNAPVFTNRFGFLQGIKKEADYTINNSAFDILFRTNVFPGF